MRDIITGQMSSLSSLQAGDRPLKRRDIKGYDFSTFENVEITGIDMDSCKQVSEDE